MSWVKKLGRSIFRITVGVVGGIALLFGTCWLDWRFPAHQSVQKDGWRFEYHHRRFACEICSASTDRLEYQGRTLPRLAFPAEAESSGLLVITPVGALRYDSGSGYRLYHAGEIVDAEERITEDDLAACAYEVTAAPGRVRNQGTPASWIAIPLGDRLRWISPERAIDVGW
ncbi:MAG: hypothetical protein AMXMBFR47_26700 [Planctomycetota bacterium]